MPSYRATNLSVLPSTWMPAAKSPDQYKVLGRPVTARGMADIVSGKWQFLQDMELPGMLHARVVRPARIITQHCERSMTPRSDALKPMEFGLSATAVFWLLPIPTNTRLSAAYSDYRQPQDWDHGPGLEPQDIFERLDANERISLPVVDGTPQEAPVPPKPAAPANAVATLSARYDRPYHMHASIGPSAGAALWQDGTLTVWSHSQGIYVIAGCDGGRVEPAGRGNPYPSRPRGRLLWP